ncbi:MAG: hypothetical protein AAGA91_01415 [Pseudomonadota bacterium]
MNAEVTQPRPAVKLLGLVLIFLLALVPRLFSAQTLGWDWDYPGSFMLVNFDEGGSCRAALQGFDYSPFVGRQTIAITTALGSPPPALGVSDAQVKRYCHSVEHLMVARGYAAVTGALTAALVVLLTWMLAPALPAAAWVAGALVAVSPFHMAESHSGTVDAPSVFFIYLFITVFAFAVRNSYGSDGAAPSASNEPSKRWVAAAWVAVPLLLLAAVWTKYWVFAPFALLALLPVRWWQYISHGMARWQWFAIPLAGAGLFGAMGVLPFRDSRLVWLLALFYLLIPWRKVHPPMAVVWLLVPPLTWAVCQIELIAHYTASTYSGRFGTSYGAVGWNKPLRNLLNLPLLLMLGLGLPACLFLPAGARAIARGQGRARVWCCLLPLGAFALFMWLVAPITYYRHYLALIPAAAIVAAVGLFSTRWGQRRWMLLVVIAWPALLAVDYVSDYHRDPRMALRQWYQEHPGARVYFSYYVNPPRGHNQLFRPELAGGDGAALRQGEYLILSENWYDTSFANELNGPLVSDPGRLIKTKPEYVAFYRTALAGEHPYLTAERTLALHHFMPELLLHRWLYGNPQVFVGDLKIFRIHD